MTRFAFIVHPIHAKDAARKYPWMKWLPDGMIDHLQHLRPPQHIHDQGQMAETLGDFDLHLCIIRKPLKK